MITCAGRICWPDLASGILLAGPLVSFPLCWESSCCSNTHGVMNPGPPTTHSPPQKTSKTQPRRNVVSRRSGWQRLPVAPSCSSAPSQQHQAIASNTWVLHPPQLFQHALLSRCFLKYMKRKCISPSTLHYWLITQWLIMPSLIRNLIKDVVQIQWTPHSNYLYIISLSFRKRTWLTTV